MVTICKIKNYNPPRVLKRGYIKENYYSVHLPDERIIFFKSKQETFNFLRKTNKKINLIAHELIDLHAEINVLFWKKIQSSVFDKKMLEYIEISSNCLIRLLTNTSGIDGTFFIFNFLKKTIFSQKEAIILMKKQNNSRNLTVILNRIDFLNEQLDSIGLKEGI